MTEQEKKINSLKDNIAMAMVAVARNIDSIVNDDDRPIGITIDVYPYKDSVINIARFETKNTGITKDSGVDINES